MTEFSMSTMSDTAMKFFEACESGKGWEACKEWCAPDAAFSCQAEPLVDVRSLQAYTEWMRGLMGMMPDGRYDLKSFAVDEPRRTVTAYAVFMGTHTGPGGPPPTGKSTHSDYVYNMQFADGKIHAMTKIWNSGWALKELGW
jgi:predicted ester cyclase